MRDPGEMATPISPLSTHIGDRKQISTNLDMVDEQRCDPGE